MKENIHKWQPMEMQDHAEYETAKREAKITVAVESVSAAQDLYERLETQ